MADIEKKASANDPSISAAVIGIFAALVTTVVTKGCDFLIEDYKTRFVSDPARSLETEKLNVERQKIRSLEFIEAEKLKFEREKLRESLRLEREKAKLPESK